ncbi:MAG: PDZ domain-containing protein, partial [Planctomycetota bacterium]
MICRPLSCAAFFVAVALLFSSVAFGQDVLDPAVEFTVDLSDVRNHYVTVTATVPVEGNRTQMMMAVWTPGSYLVREYARHVDSIEVTDQDGNELNYSKTRKNRWTVQTRDVESFNFKYRVYCNEMSVRTNFVSHQYAMLNGAPTFITVRDRLERPHIVRFKMPEGWQRIATSLRQGEDAYEFIAESFDELVDSPVVAGSLNIYPFMAGGVQHHLVNIGDDRMWDGTEAAADLKKIVEQHQALWGEIPYDRYYFLNVIGETGGGLEHDNSTLVLSSRWTFRDRGRYRGWLSLCSHEFFHTWNVRRLRPKSLMEYDYENEDYTRSLWIAEGVTSYYEDLLLARGGLMSAREFVGILGGTISGVQSTPGRKKQSLTESSYDSWIKFYRPDENSSNTRISYYSKGTVVAFLLDAEIRSQTEGEKSLDDVLRLMWQRYAATGYTERDFRRVCSEVAGVDLTEWFRIAVDSTEELDYVRANRWFGFSFSADEQAQRAARTAAREERRRRREEGGGDDAESDEEEEEIDFWSIKAPEFDENSPWIGASVSDGVVTRVRPESPATEAGLNLDDEVLAIDGLRISGSISSRINRMEVGDEIEMLIARRGEIMTLRLTIGPSPRSNWRYGYAGARTDRQEERVDEWMSPTEFPVPEQEQVLEEEQTTESTEETENAADEVAEDQAAEEAGEEEAGEEEAGEEEAGEEEAGEEEAGEEEAGEEEAGEEEAGE